MDKLREAFTVFDKNRDGTITTKVTFHNKNREGTITIKVTFNNKNRDGTGNGYGTTRMYIREYTRSFGSSSGK